MGYISFEDGAVHLYPIPSDFGCQNSVNPMGTFFVYQGELVRSRSQPISLLRRECSVYRYGYSRQTITFSNRNRFPHVSKIWLV